MNPTAMFGLTGALGEPGAPGAPGEHPQDACIGVIVAGAAARAAANTASEPTGAAATGLAAKGRAHAIDSLGERAFWSENFTAREYVEPGSSFDDYSPAYGLGVNAQARYPGRDFDDVETELSSHWAASRGGSRLSWEQARPAVRDAWNRIAASN